MPIPSEKYTLQDLVPLLEETNKELRNKAWKQVSARVKSQNLIVTYLGVNKNGVISFKCTSGTTPGQFWYQQIVFKDFALGLQILSESPKSTQRDLINLLQKGDLLVYCNDPSFKYFGWQYIGTKNGYSLKSETRYPKKRNPNLTGSICKHLVAVLPVLPML